MNNVIGTKFKLVKGYAGSAAMRLAMERGEIEGFCGVGYNSMRTAGLADGKANILVQVGLSKNPTMPNVPFVFDYAKTDADRQLFRWCSAGSISSGRSRRRRARLPDRVQALREGFDKAMKDPALLADAEKVNVGIEPMSGDGDREVRRGRLADAGGGDLARGANLSGESAKSDQLRSNGRRRSVRAIRQSLGLHLRHASLSLSLRRAAQTVEQFYNGRQVNIDRRLQSRRRLRSLRARGRAASAAAPAGIAHIVIKNMQGAGSVIAANHLYNVAPRDGSELGVIAGGAALEPVYGKKNAQFDGRHFIWLGSANEEIAGCLAWHTSAVQDGRGFVQTGDDHRRVRRFEPRISDRDEHGARDEDEARAWLPTVRPTILLALERGEVQGMCGMVNTIVGTQRPDWLREQESSHPGADRPRTHGAHGRPAVCHGLCPRARTTGACCA